MPTTKITSKGQITLPKEVREHLKVHPGDRLLFTIMPDGRVVIEPPVDIRDLKGFFDTGDIHLTIEEINAAISQMGTD